MNRIGNRIQDWIDKVEKITASSYIETSELEGLIEFFESIDEENRILVEMLRTKINNLDLIDVAKNLLEYYNVIDSDRLVSEKKSKIFSVKGKLVRSPFDLSKYEIPSQIQETIEKLKKC